MHKQWHQFALSCKGSGVYPTLVDVRMGYDSCWTCRDSTQGGREFPGCGCGQKACRGGAATLQGRSLFCDPLLTSDLVLLWSPRRAVWRGVPPFHQLGRRCRGAARSPLAVCSRTQASLVVESADEWASRAWFYLRIPMHQALNVEAVDSYWEGSGSPQKAAYGSALYRSLGDGLLLATG